MRKTVRKPAAKRVVKTPSIKPVQASKLDIAAARATSALWTGNIVILRGIVVGVSDEAIAISEANMASHKAAILAALS